MLLAKVLQYHGARECRNRPLMDLRIRDGRLHEWMHECNLSRARVCVSI